MTKKLQLSVKFHFAASHFLTQYHGKCEDLHGHNYKLVVTIEGEVQKDGMVHDFKEIKKIVKEKIISKLDHKHLNDILDNPSSEYLAIWIWDKLKNDLPLTKVAVSETDNYTAEYAGE